MVYESTSLACESMGLLPGPAQDMTRMHTRYRKFLPVRLDGSRFGVIYDLDLGEKTSRQDCARVVRCVRLACSREWRLAASCSDIFGMAALHSCRVTYRRQPSRGRVWLTGVRDAPITGRPSRSRFLLIGSLVGRPYFSTETIQRFVGEYSVY